MYATFPYCLLRNDPTENQNQVSKSFKYSLNRILLYTDKIDKKRGIPKGKIYNGLCKYCGAHGAN